MLWKDSYIPAFILGVNKNQMAANLPAINLANKALLWYPFPY